MTATPPLSLEDAQARLVALAPAMPVEHRLAAECAGLALAEPVFARRDQPAQPTSAMDGYALRAADLPGPWRVIGESAAGHPFAGTVGPGEAVRISTGAALPEGADCVLLQEDCKRDETTLQLTGTPPAPPGRHIRVAALDFARGTELLTAGTRLGPAQIALAIAGNHRLLPVRSAPRVAVLDCGDELVPPGEDPGLDRIPASNGAMLATMVGTLPCTVTAAGPVPDQLPALVTAFERCADADVIVTSGGASVGDHDLIRPALARIGAELAFWRVAIKPGKPLLVARRGRQLIVGLPGNPASAYVTAYLFLLPLLRAMLGMADPIPRTLPVPLGAPLPAGGSRTEFLRGWWDGATVTVEDRQDSGSIGPLARANALVRRDARAPAEPAGAMAQTYLLALSGLA